MALVYVAAYYSYLELMEELSDAECGRLFKACITYGKTGVAPDLRGNERFVWPTIKTQIDRDAEKYKMRCEQNRNNRKRSSTVVDDGQRPTTKTTKEKEKEKENTKENTGVSPLTPLAGVSLELSEAFSSWLDYKRERRESYKPTGLKSLVVQVKKAAEEYGDHAVSELIRECMASNWSGIIFDRLRKGVKRDGAGALHGPGTAQGNTFNGFKPKSALDD